MAAQSHIVIDGETVKTTDGEAPPSETPTPPENTDKVRGKNADNLLEDIKARYATDPLWKRDTQLARLPKKHQDAFNVWLAEKQKAEHPPAEAAESEAPVFKLFQANTAHEADFSDPDEYISKLEDMLEKQPSVDAVNRLAQSNKESFEKLPIEGRERLQAAFKVMIETLEKTADAAAASADDFPPSEDLSAPAPEMKLTLDDVRAELLKVNEKFGMDAAKAIVTGTGGKEKISDVEPEKYAAIKAKCDEKLKSGGSALD